MSTIVQLNTVIPSISKAITYSLEVKSLLGASKSSPLLTFHACKIQLSTTHHAQECMTFTIHKIWILLAVSLTSVYRDIGEHESGLGPDAGPTICVKLETVLFAVYVLRKCSILLVTEESYGYVTRSTFGGFQHSMDRMERNLESLCLILEAPWPYCTVRVHYK